MSPDPLPPTSLDPYAAPASAAAAAPVLPGAWIKWVYGTLLALRLALFGVTTFLNLDHDLRIARLLGTTVLAIVMLGLGFAWLYTSFRHTVDAVQALDPRAPGQSPAAVVGSFFVPLYNIFWMFGVHFALCRRFKQLASLRRRDLGRRIEAVRDLGLAGSALQIGFTVLTRLGPPPEILRVALVMPALWLVYMALADGVRTRLAECRVEGPW
jgi:hypothetical protein